jgi:hypothetical protein
MGFVKSNSIVPFLFSSANERIVIAGIRNMKTHGEMKNNVSILEYFISSTLESPGKIHMNKPVISRNTAITTYPISELRKVRISFFSNAIIISTRLSKHSN